ncbi:MAG: DUF3368 domain-containing protein [Balneolaceae bacterium]|nr:DUF3368 domain-containing protein [Balneolaceae bacterium]MDR9409669.1 DUF3368 domain-containing protein [Balneolaceae bacterium]
MPTNSNSIVLDTSCLILLTKIDEIRLIKLPEVKVFTTPQVFKEFKEPLPTWVHIKDPPKKRFQKVLQMNIDVGEASAIALATKIDKSILIIDDLKGRKIAENLKIRYSGTLGLIIQAKREGIIETVKPIVNKIEKTNFRIDRKLLLTVLEQAGE